MVFAATDISKGRVAWRSRSHTGFEEGRTGETIDLTANWAETGTSSSEDVRD
jgi:hypothetical protein